MCDSYYHFIIVITYIVYSCSTHLSTMRITRENLIWFLCFKTEVVYLTKLFGHLSWCRWLLCSMWLWWLCWCILINEPTEYYSIFHCIANVQKLSTKSDSWKATKNQTNRNHFSIAFQVLFRVSGPVRIIEKWCRSSICHTLI